MPNTYISEAWIENKKDALKKINDDFQEVLYELNVGYEESDILLIIATMKKEMNEIIDGLEWARNAGKLLPITDNITFINDLELEGRWERSPKGWLFKDDI